MRSLELSEQRRLRHEIVGIVEQDKADLDPDIRCGIELVVGEIATNLSLHGKCAEVELSVAVLKETEKAIITFEDECFKDPKEVESWFEESQVVDLYRTSHRGIDHVKHLCEYEIRQGAIDFIFNLTPVAELSEPQLATA